MATRYLIDTNTLTALANRDANARANVAGLTGGDILCSCFVVIGEWEYGILSAPGPHRQAQIRASGRSVLASLSVVWQSTPTIVRRYAALSAHLRTAGQQIPTNDLWIAATALARGAVLVTSDRHFLRVPGLTVADWSISPSQPT